MTTETTSAGKKAGGNGDGGTAPAAKTVQVDIRLRGIEGSERPVLSNFTTVQAAPGMVFVDFGFLEPQAFESIARAGRTGAKMSEAVTGQLASRVAMNLQTANQLAQQLNEMLRRAQRQATAAGAKATAAPAKPQ
jgi:hypothetical protein